MIIHSFDIENQSADIFYRVGKSVAISKRYNILIHCGSQNRNPKSYRKV